MWAPRLADWRADGEFVPGSDEDGGGRWVFDRPVPREGWELGWNEVPLFGTQEIDCPTGIPLCVRVLILLNTEKSQHEIQSIYQAGAVVLRPDLSMTETRQS